MILGLHLRRMRHAIALVVASYLSPPSLNAQPFAPKPLLTVTSAPFPKASNRLDRPEQTRSRRTRIVIGTAIGAIAGGFLGYQLEASSCRGCDFAPPLIAATTVGVVVGGFIGGGIATMVRSRASSSHHDGALNTPSYRLPVRLGPLIGTDEFDHLLRGPSAGRVEPGWPNGEQAIHRAYSNR